jgi:hypothetical protein
MIVSHRYKFIFIKTLKTAGTSIEIFLSQHCGEGDIVTPIIPHVEPHVARNYKGLWNFIPDLRERGGWNYRRVVVNTLKANRYFNHMPAQFVRRRLSPDVWNGYLKFCVERNPWDKTLSHYHWLKNRSHGSMTLEDYFSRGSFCINHPLYTDKAGRAMVDRIVKFETMMDELGDIFGGLGIPFQGSLGVKAKSEQRQDRAPYQQVFTSEQKRTIDRVFAKEIELLGYTF